MFGFLSVPCRRNKGSGTFRYLFRISWQLFVASDRTEWQNREKPSSLSKSDWAAALTDCENTTTVDLVGGKPHLLPLHHRRYTDLLLPGEQQRALCFCGIIQRTLCHLFPAQPAGCLISSCVHTATPNRSLTTVSLRIHLLSTSIKHCAQFVACIINTLTLCWSFFSCLVPPERPLCSFSRKFWCLMSDCCCSWGTTKRRTILFVSADVSEGINQPLAPIVTQDSGKQRNSRCARMDWCFTST